MRSSHTATKSSPRLPQLGAFLVAQLVKTSPAKQETWVQPLGWEDPLEEGMAICSNVLAWRIFMGRGAWRAAVHRVGCKESDMTE